MASTKPERNDVAIAQKAINLVYQLHGANKPLSAADKRVAAAILAHFNKETGQCDPSNERLAGLLGIDVRTVRRATEEICREGGLFRKRSHGGKSCRASYTPEWSVFRGIVEDWDRRMKSGEGPDSEHDHRANSPGCEGDDAEGEQGELVRQTGRTRPVEQGELALQTHIRNSYKEPIPSLSASECDAARDPETKNSEQMANGLGNGERAVARPPGYQARELAATQGSSRFDASVDAANARLMRAIEGMPAEARGALWEFLDDEGLAASIDAERRKIGTGLRKALWFARDRRIKAAARAYAERASDHVH